MRIKNNIQEFMINVIPIVTIYTILWFFELIYDKCYNITTI